MRHQCRTARTPARVFRLLAIVSAAVAMLGGGGASLASAATFTVDPTQIFLRNRTGSVLLTLHNQSADSLSFQLSVFAWTQSSTGEMQLQPTQDIVFFPPLLTLKPSETRRVRVGTATTFDAKEKSYRIFVEELPPTDAPKGVRVLTKMGIPIFLRPVKEVATASLTDLRQQNGQLKFTLSNEGTVHFVPRNIKVRGLAGSKTAFERELEGWYLLAGGRRDFETALPKDACAQVTSIIVDVQFESNQVQERLQTPTGACAR
ncbi:MAG TPA: fimbria/pilus periplasmic chaperone [Vicinamibacterales bacterium]|nr:fimbria/pilus periplasmic chaperone [Vicinamibacterales bacterium]